MPLGFKGEGRWGMIVEPFTASPQRDAKLGCHLTRRKRHQALSTRTRFGYPPPLSQAFWGSEAHSP